MNVPTLMKHIFPGEELSPRCRCPGQRLATAHSKVDGLRIFREVHVDLVAPAELQMPEDLVQQMVRQACAVTARRLQGGGEGN